MEYNTMGLLDNMLDESLDGIEVAAEFVDLPSGEYMLNITKASAKEYQAKDNRPAGVRVNVIYAVLNTVALQDVNQTPADDGSLASESFNLNEQGLPYFKRFLTNIFGDTSGISLRDSIQALEGMQIKAIIRVTTKDGRSYMSTTRQSQA